MEIIFPLKLGIIFSIISVFLAAGNGNPPITKYGVHNENDPCQNSSDCNEDYEQYTCEKSTGKCHCEVGETYVKDLNTYTCLLLAPKLEDECEFDEQCTASNTFCSDGKCWCEKGYYYSTESKGCLIGYVTFGEPCQIDEQCPYSSYCGDDGTCRCPLRTHANSLDQSCQSLWYAGNMSGLIIGVFTVVIILTAILGYFGYQQLEKGKTRKLEPQAFVSGMKTSNMMEQADGSKATDLKTLL